MNKVMMALTLAGYLAMWVAKVRADGKITADEIAELLQQIGEIFQVKELAQLQIEWPAPPAQAPGQPAPPAVALADAPVPATGLGSAAVPGGAVVRPPLW